MFETVKNMFSQDPAFWREASGNRFYDDFELDFGSVLGAKLAHISPFGRPGRRERIAVLVELWNAAEISRLLHRPGGQSLCKGLNI